MSAITRILIRIARAVVQQVISMIRQQLDIVDNEVKTRLNSYIEEVVGGAWKGKGADAFVASIREEALPMLTDMVDTTNELSRGILRGVEIMDEADAQVRGLVSGLEDQFNAI